MYPSATEIFYIVIGLLSVALVVGRNARLYSPGARLGAVGTLEGLYYATALAALLIGWYFNLLYFPMSLLTSYAFGIALFLAMRERQWRWQSINADGHCPHAG